MSGKIGIRSAKGAWIAMVGDQVDRIKDWLYSGDVAHLGKTHRD